MKTMVMHKTMPDNVKSNPIYIDIWRRIYRYNKNFMCVFCGGTGDGKSYAALTMAHNLDRDLDGESRFNADKVVFLPSDFLSQVRKPQNKGSFLVWDETGVGINTKEWYSLKNKLISYTIQTFRFKNMGVLYTVPAISFVESQVRVLFHAAVTMKYVSIVDKRGVGSFEWMQFNPKTAKIYYKKPRYYIDGRKVVVDAVRFPLPPPDLLEEYEAKKKEMTDNWYDIYNEQLEFMKKSTESKENKMSKLAGGIYEDAKTHWEDFIDVKKGGFSANYLMIHYDINKDKAYAVSAMLGKDMIEGTLKPTRKANAIAPNNLTSGE